MNSCFGAIMTVIGLFITITGVCNMVLYSGWWPRNEDATEDVLIAIIAVFVIIGLVTAVMGAINAMAGVWKP